MPPVFQHDDNDHDFKRFGGGGGVVRVASAPTLTAQAFRLPPIRRRLPAAPRGTPNMLLRRPRRWLQLSGGTIMGLVIGILVGMATR